MLLYFTVGKNAFRGKNDDRKGGPFTGFLQNEIGFDKQQMQLFDSLGKQHRSSMKPLFDDLGKSKDSLYQMIGNTSVSDSVLQQTAAVIGKKQAVLDLQFFQNFQSVRKICTPAQQPKFDSLMPMLARRMMQPWHRFDAQRKTDKKK